jgi:hypothetical protein
MPLYGLLSHFPQRINFTYRYDAPLPKVDATLKRVIFGMFVANFGEHTFYELR